MTRDNCETFFDFQGQTWKKARTRGHCPRKFLRIAEIFKLLKIMHLYFQKKTFFLLKCLMKHLTLFRGGGQKRLRAPSLLNFDKNNHRMWL